MLNSLHLREVKKESEGSKKIRTGGLKNVLRYFCWRLPLPHYMSWVVSCSVLKITSGVNAFASFELYI